MPQRVLFVTVGTTALSAVNLGAASNIDASKLRANAKEFLDSGLAGNQLFTEVLQAHRDIWSNRNLRIGGYVDYLSAEMTSTYFMLKVQQAEHHPVDPPLWQGPDDRIVLLSSDTPQGKFCARINAALMHEFIVHRGCQCGGDFTGEPPHCRAKVPCVTVETIEGLEARRTGFNIAGPLGNIFATHSAKADEIIVNYTGGYKGPLPALTLLCHGQATRFWMFYAHETMDRAERISFTAAGELQQVLLATDHH